jgi:flagellin
MLDVEYSQLLQELDLIALTTRFGSNRLLDGTEKTYEYQVGAYNGPENVLKYESETNTRADALGVEGLSVADKDSALDSIDIIDEALQEIGKARAGFASVQSRLQSVQNNGQIQVENLEAARSRLADTDIAQAAADMFKAQALTQFQIAVMAQANQQPIQALKLLL